LGGGCECRVRLADGNLEYKSRTEAEAQPLPVADVLSFLQARIRR